MEIENLLSPDDGVVGGLPVAKRRRVAVIAVHGVADQKLGDTCQALAELLIAQTPNGFVYEPGLSVERWRNAIRKEICRSPCA